MKTTRLGACVVVALLAVVAGSVPQAGAAGGNIVISQLYGGGGNVGASLSNDFVELYNPGSSAVTLDGLSIQYTSAVGVGLFGASSTQLTELSGIIQPHRYFLVQEASSGAVGVSLPSPDQTDASPINMAAASGKVVLVTGTGSLGCNGGPAASTPCSAAALARIIDLVGYGTTNFFEGSAPAPTLSSTTSAQRKLAGCQDTDDNAADFTAEATAPRTSTTALHVCDADQPPSVSSTAPASGALGVPRNSNIAITFSEDVNVAGGWFAISCASSGIHAATVSGGPKIYTLDPIDDFDFNETCTVTIDDAGISDADASDPPDNMTSDYVFGFTTEAADEAPSVTSTSPASGASDVARDANITITFGEDVNVTDGWYSISCASSGVHPATVGGGPKTYTLDPTGDFDANETCTVTIDDTGVSDVDTNDPPDNMASDYAFSFTTRLEVTQIAQVQGATHVSPYAGQLVLVEGVVIAKRGSNVWLQDPTPDADPATSEGILVFGSSVANAVSVGDLVQVRGTVAEFRPGCTPSCLPTSSAFSNLSITEVASPGLGVTKLSSGNPLPAVTVIGAGGRITPTTVIEDDATATGNVETSGVFDPTEDGIDFYESLESMLVQVNNPVVVGPRNDFGEILVLADDGADAAIRTARGGIVISPTDFNPERIMLDDLFRATPSVDVADHFTTSAVGVMTYDFANYKIAVTTALTEVDGGLQREVTRAPDDQEIVVGTYNVENLDPGDGAAYARHADYIVNHLRSPDLLAIEEIQDNNGPTNDSVTDASLSWSMLIAAIQAAGGPTYAYRQIDPVDDQDGGEPGGNIRVGFLFRTDRGLNFIDRPGGDSSTPTTVVETPSGPQLSHSPGRVDPLNPAFAATRKSLAGEFRMHGKKVFVIANHFSSKGGDQPLFGRFQPPARSSEPKRHDQAQAVNAFVDSILAADPAANVIVLGDINDFEFSDTVSILEGDVLTTLMDTLPKAERYSYDFEGNSQVLDQILVSDNLLTNFPIDYDPVHVNSEFADQASDHDPQVARLDLRGRPTPKGP